MNMDELSITNNVPTVDNNRELNADELSDANASPPVNNNEANMDEVSVENINLITVLNSENCSFKINHAKTKDFGINQFVRSSTFTCSGYDWSIRYYPQGSHGTEFPGYMSLYLNLESNAENVNTSVTFHLLGEDSKPLTSRYPWLLFQHKGSSGGFKAFIKRSQLESEYIKYGCFVISCDIKILNDDWEQTSVAYGLTPFNSLHAEFHGLLKQNEMIDVDIEVAGETIAAHSLVLAARSTTFKELITNMMDGAIPSYIILNDISPIVFKTLLHFMYTDALPPIQELFENGYTEGNVDLYELSREVLVASDMYRLDGLKRICEEKLAKHMSMETIVTSLDLAYHHNCPHLKGVCFEFASKPENIMEFMQSDGYVDLMKRCPSLLEEFRECNIFCPFKKQRTK